MAVCTGPIQRGCGKKSLSETALALTKDGKLNKKKNTFHNKTTKSSSMKFLQRIIEKMNWKEPAKQLGRWNLTYCEKTMNQKIDLSNEDHCGPCGQYRIDKMAIKQPLSVNPITKNSK
jgi:hypothetical protein